MGVAGQMFACLIACFHLLKTAIYFNKFAITQIIKSLIRPKWTQPRRSGSALLGNGKLGPPFGDRSRTGAWRASGCPVFDPWDPKELCWATKEIRVGGGFPASCNTIQCFPHRPAPTCSVLWSVMRWLMLWIGTIQIKIVWLIYWLKIWRKNIFS